MAVSVTLKPTTPAANELTIEGKYISWTEGMTANFNVIVPSGTISGTPVLQVYRHGSPAPLTGKVTGACTVSGNVVTTGTVSDIKGKIIFALTITIDGSIYVYRWFANVSKPHKAA